MLLRAIALLLAANFIGLAQDWTEARRLYYLAVDGDRSSGERSIELLDGILASNARASKPQDPLLLVYRGSLSLLQSSWTLAPWRKGKLAKEGLAMMDRAVEMAPRDLEVRFVRAASTMRLPGFFHRAEQSAADFAEIAPLVPEAVRAGKLEPRLGKAALTFHQRISQKPRNP